MNKTGSPKNNFTLEDFIPEDHFIKNTVYSTQECDEALLRGLNQVHYIFDNDHGYNIGSKKKSPFTLIKKYVDIPFLNIINRYKNHHKYLFFKAVIPSKMGSLFKGETGSYFDQKAYSVDQYDEFIRELCHKEIPTEVFHALDNLRLLILNIENRRTPKIKAEKFCRYCWRYTQAQKKINGYNYVSPPKRHSKKYCDEHSLSGKKSKKQNKNWNSYIKARRYADEFQKEMELLEFPTDTTSKFAPILTFLYSYWRGGITPIERRKLIYDLVHSRKYTSRRLEILNLYFQKKSSSHIAKILKIPKYYVDRDLELLQEDLTLHFKRMYDVYDDNQYRKIR